MPLQVTHSTVVAIPDDGTSAVGSDEWNAQHTITGSQVAGSSGQVQYNNSGAFGGFTLGGDATLVASTGVMTIGNDVVTYAKMQNVSATSRFLGRITAAAGDVEELTGTQATTLLDVFTSALKGLVPLSGGGSTNFLRADGGWNAPPLTPPGGSPNQIQFNSAGAFGGFTMGGDATLVVGTGALTIAGGAVTYGKMQNVTASRLLGNPTGSAVAPSEISLGAALTFSGTALQTVAHTGDVTSPANSVAMTIANLAVTYAKMQNVAASRLLGNPTGSVASPSEISLGAALTFSGSALQTVAHTGDVTSPANSVAMTIGNDVVTYAKMQNVSATSRFLGRITVGAGDPEELTGTQATTLLDVFTSALKGLVPLSGGGTANFLRADGGWNPPPLTPPGGSPNQVQYNNAGAFGGFTMGGDATLVVGTGALTIAAKAVSYAKIQDVAASRLLGNPTGAVAAPSEISLGAALTFSGTVLQTVAHTGDVTSPANSVAMTIANAAVTYAKMQNVAASRLLGNPTGSAASASEISLGAALTFSGTALQTVAHTGDVTSAANSLAMTIPNDTVTYAKMQNVSATSRILGRITTGAGDPEELTGTQVTSLLDNFTSTLKGLAPLSGGGTVNYLRADGSWQPPPGAIAISGSPSAGQKAEWNDGTSIKGTPSYWFHVNRSTQQSIPDAVQTKVQFNVEVADTQNCYDNATNYRFTPTLAGKYLFTASVYIPATAVSVVVSYFYKNGAEHIRGMQVYTSGAVTLHLNGVIDMNGSTDYVEVFAYQQSGAAVNCGGQGSYMFFTGYRLGA